MQYVGFALAGLAVILVIVALLQQLKMKKILAAPFKKTGEIANNPSVADGKGRISTEGAVKVQQSMTAPCSGKPCVYYEIEVERLWEKHVNTENGMRRETGKVSLRSENIGSHFALDDGSGPIQVDAREKVTSNDLVESFCQTQNVSSGDVHFGQYRVQVPYQGGDEHTTGVKCTEKIIAPDGNLFVMGKLAAGAITKEDGVMGKLLISLRGRDKLVGSTKTKMIVAYVFAVLFLGPGVYFSAFGTAPKDTCANLENATEETCTSRMYDDDGKDFEWSVTKPGVYAITVSQPAVKNPIFAKVTVKKGSKVISRYIASGKGSKAILVIDAAKGSYTINVTDRDRGYVRTIKGGFGFSLDIKATKDKPTQDSEDKQGEDDKPKSGKEEKSDKEDGKKDDDKAGPAKKKTVDDDK